MQLDESNKTRKNDQPFLKETSKNRNIIAKLQGNPQRLQGLKESFKYFNLLKKNQYLERKQFRVSRDEALVCSCIKCSEDQIQNRPQGPQFSYNCGERCLNRFTCTECDVEMCPSGEFCKNRRFQKHDDACVYPLRCGGKGMGLFAGERILKGQFIMQYVGEIFQINSALGRRRVQEYSKSTCTYLMKLNNQEVIDPTSKGNLARFINHSCEPNCITEKWNVLGEVCIGIFAIRDINEDEELTFDYQFDVFHTPLTKCLCGANKCKGYLGLKPTDVTQEEWEEHLENMVCKICQTKTPQDDEQLLLCDKCNCGFHLLCLIPPLQSVPKDAWYCQECQDEKRILEEQEKEKAKIEGLFLKKMKILNNENNRKKKDESSSSSSDSDSEYDNRYKMMKLLEKQTVREYLTQKQQQQLQLQQYDDKRNIKDDQDNNISDLQLPQQVHIKSSGTSINNLDYNIKSSVDLQPQYNGKLQQMQSIVDVAQKKFEEQFNLNIELQNQIDNIEQQQSFQNIDTMKECFKINILEQKVVKKNAPLIYKIGYKISFEQIDQQYADFFKKENNLTVIGSVQQINIFRTILTMIEQIIKELKRELGIIEGQIKVPIIYLKRLIMKFNSLDKKQEVNIIYNKSLAHSEEIFPMDKATPIKIKGSKQNIDLTVQEIAKTLKTLCVQRLYISRSETKTVQQNMYQLKQHAEIRISRDSVYNAKGEQTQRDINHPFFYIQYREKEVCLIGTLQQIQETSNAIKLLLEQETNNDKEMTYFTVLISPQYKEHCKQVKQIIERNSSSTKVLLFEASHPRKNMTILVLCLRSQIKQTKIMFSEMIQEYCQLKLDQFQDQMSMQMCRYVFKYLQNTMMTNDMAFMKNWDLITPYFYQFNIMKYREQKFDNWFVKRCYPSLLRDYETQLYIQYCLGKEIQRSLTDQELILRKKNLILLTKRILNAILGFKRHQTDQTQIDNNSFQIDPIRRLNSIQEDDTPKIQGFPLLTLQVQQSQFSQSQFSRKSEILKEISNKSSSESPNQKYNQQQKKQSSSESEKSRDLSTKYKHKYNSNHYHRHNQNQRSPDRQDRQDRQERLDRQDRQDRSERQDRSDRQDRSERQDRQDRSDRQDRQDRSDRYDKHKYDKSSYYNDKQKQKQKYQSHKIEKSSKTSRKYYDDNEYSRTKGYNRRRSSSEISQKSYEYRKKRQESVDSDKYKNNKYYSGFQFERRYPKVYKYDYEKSTKIFESKDRSRSRQRNKSDSSDSYKRRSKSTHKSKKYCRKYQ